MSIFQYKAHNKAGEKINGMVEAENEANAIDILEEKNYRIISLEEKKALPSVLSVLNRIKPKDLVVFSRQFSVLISATVPVVQSLRILIDQTENLKLKMIISEIADDVDGGTKLSEAMSKYGNVFNKFYISVIKSGETSGKLDDILDYLANEMEKSYDLKSKIKSAMIYPAFVLSGLGLVGIGMMVFVLPKLTDIIKQSGMELPLSTKILIFSSDVLSHYWLLLILVLLFVIIGIKLIVKTKQGKYIKDFILLKLPIFGNLFKKIYIVRFTRSLQTLIVSGITLTIGLKIVSEIVENSIYQKVLNQAVKDVEDGNPLSATLEKSKVIPKMLSQMISIGETTGKLDLVLDKITKFYTREINSIVENLLTLMEPIIIVVIGIAVGIMVAAIIMPMYNMAQAY